MIAQIREMPETGVKCLQQYCELLSGLELELGTQLPSPARSSAPGDNPLHPKKGDLKVAIILPQIDGELSPATTRNEPQS